MPLSPTNPKNPDTLVLKPDHFKVSGDGVFYTLQGEGPTMGFPACFLRLHLCNLQCAWCDTWYTWDKNTPEFWEESSDWTILETKTKLEQAWGCANPLIQKRVVITGGEPLLQQGSIEKLMRLMPDWIFEIETNGTVMPSDYLLQHCQFNCSPKLTNSGNPRPLRIRGDVVQKLNTANTTFKFVVTAPEDLDEIEKEYITPFNLDLEKIIVMSEGKTAAEVSHHALLVAEAAKQKGFRLLTRIQLDIWGAKRKT